MSKPIRLMIDGLIDQIDQSNLTSKIVVNRIKSFIIYNFNPNK